MNFKKGDKVVVISGKSKGALGTISNVLKDNKVIVEGANMVKKHIVEVEAPIDASNVMLVDPKTKKRTRIGHTTDKKGNKVRVSKKSNEELN